MGNSKAPWKRKWSRELSKPENRVEFQEGLERRWTENVRNFPPCALRSGYESNADLFWWRTFEEFLADGPHNEEIANQIVSAFEGAYEEVQPDVGFGRVWLHDILALRRLEIKDNPDLAHRLVRLLIDTLNKVSEAFPGPTAQDYTYFYGIYDAVTVSVVSEVYEKREIDIRYKNRLSNVPFDKFSWFQVLETYRFCNVEKQIALGKPESVKSEEVEGSLRVAVTRMYRKELEGYKLLPDTIEAYNLSLEKLFYKLVDINAVSFGAGSEQEKRDALFLTLRNARRSDRFALQQFITVQRKLDIHLLRVARMQTGELKDEADLYCYFVKKVSETNKEIGATDLRYHFVDELPITLIPRGRKRTKKIADSKGNIVCDVDSDEIQELGKKFPKNFADLLKNLFKPEQDENEVVA